MSDLNPNLPEFPDFDLEIVEIKAKPRKLKATWSQEAADDLVWYRFGPGDWVWNTRTRRVGTVITREKVADPRNEEYETVYEVEDMETAQIERFGDHELEGPLNEMEVLARVRSMI
jgi:hypothetical protein